MTIKVDLLPDEQKKSGFDFTIVLYFVGLALILAGLVFYSQSLQDQIIAVEKDIAEQKTEVDRMKKDLPIIEQTKSRIAELKSQYEQIKGLKNDPRRYANLLQEITMLMPDTVWWDKVSINPATKSMEFSGSSAEILGALPLSTIANYMRDINESTYFSNPIMSTASENETEDVRGFSFSLNFNYDPELAAQQDPPSLTTAPLEVITPAEEELDTASEAEVVENDTIVVDENQAEENSSEGEETLDEPEQSTEGGEE